MNNGVYGLTKGQNSPTYQADGAGLDFDAVSLGLSIASTTFVARGFARWTDQLHRLTVAALEHARAGRGFAFLEVLSPCVTYNDTYPVWEATLDDLDARESYDPSSRAGAFAAVSELADEGRMAVGLIYRNGAGANGELARPAAEDVRPDRHAAAYADLMATFRVRSGD